MSWRSFRENVEALTVAVLLALVIRHFFVGSYEIPTGSMAAGLNGLHVTVTCPNCTTTNDVGISSDSLTNRVKLYSKLEIYEGDCPNRNIPVKIATMGANRISCPACKQAHPTAGKTHWGIASSMRAWCGECTLIFPIVVEHSDILGGNKILVDKFAYDWQQPKRWDVVVFKFNRERDYIKRLVGLPGEQIQIINGDIWIDGNIEVKTVEAQDRFWTVIHDSSIEEAGLVDSPWQSDPGWVRNGSGWDYNLIKDEGSLRYIRGIENRYNYNAFKPSGARIGPVRDLSVRATLSASGAREESDSRLDISIWNHPAEYRCSFSIGNGSTELQLIRPDMEPQLLGQLPDVSLQPGREYRIEFQVVDRSIRLFMEDELVADIPLPASELDSGLRSGGLGKPASGVSFFALNCGGKLKHVQLCRDQHWTRTSRYATSEPHQIEAHRFFVLGDNSPSSLDSRWWGSFGRSNLIGRGFSIFWPALPGRNETGFIR